MNGSSIMPDFESVRDAAKRLNGIANRTPVFTSRTLNEKLDAEVYFKCENFQRGGAFKFRGAYNAIAQLGDEKRRAGVVTYSSGNHAQAVALTGRLLGVTTLIIMPANAPVAKLTATRGYGAEVVLYDPAGQSREALAEEIQRERGMTLIPPYDHPNIVAGQGTAALELMEEVPELDMVLAPCGGGGLLSGTAIVSKALQSRCRVVGVEPELADDATRSFRTGTLQRVHNPQTVADGLRTPSLGAVTFPLIRKYVDEMVTVSEDEIVRAMQFLWARMKVVVEPSGAVALAALLGEGQLAHARRVGLILSGGNVDISAASALFDPEEASPVEP